MRRLRIEPLDEQHRGAGDEADRPRTTLSPKMWKNGRTPNTTSSGPCWRPGWAWHCSRLARRLPWVSMAAFGRAGRAAREDQHREVVRLPRRRTGTGLVPRGGRRAGRHPRCRRAGWRRRARAPAAAVRSSTPIDGLGRGAGDHGPGADGRELALDLRDRAAWGSAARPRGRRRAPRGRTRRSTSCWRPRCPTRSPGSRPSDASPPRRPATWRRRSP